MMINQVDDIVWGDCEDVYAAVKAHVRFTLLGRREGQAPFASASTKCPAAIAA